MSRRVITRRSWIYPIALSSIPDWGIDDILIADGVVFPSRLRDRRSTLHRLDPPSIALPPCQDDWRYMARYINPIWTSWPNHRSLSRAFDALERIVDAWTSSNPSIPNLDPSFQAGNPTPDQPDAIPYLLLYRLAHRVGISIGMSTSPEDVDMAIRCWIIPTSRLAEAISLRLKDRLDVAILVSKHVGLTPSDLSPVGSIQATIQESAHHRIDQPTFYRGLRDGIRNTISPILFTPIGDLDDTDIITFGVPGDMVFLTLDEIYGHFRTTMMPTHPVSRHRLPRSTISRLAQLVRLDHPEISRAIEATIDIDTRLEADYARFGLLWEQASPSDQSKIIHAGTCLLHLGMAMRGWIDSTQPYPIHHVPYAGSGDIAIAVTMAIHTWKTSLESLPEEWSRRLLNLPLVHLDSAKEIIGSIDPTIGTTIGDKIRIIQLGDDYHDVGGSCLRVASGYIACTAWKYFQAVRQPEPFSILELELVS